MFLIKKLFKLVFKFKFMNVFDITIEHAALIAEIEDCGGEITPEIATKLIINEQNLATKVRAYYHIIKTAESQINLAKDEQERLMVVRKVKENLIKKLKNTVDIAVEEFGVLKPSGAKGLDLGDLKVWQKKTEALDVTGEIDDERFCYKSIKFELKYEDAKALLELVDSAGNTSFAPLITIAPIKDKLKQWLLDNEEEHKALKQKASEISNVEFEEINGIPLPVEETQEDKDLKIILNAKVNHNSTVIFK